MTQNEAIKEIDSHIDSLESTILYMEKCDPGRNLSIYEYKKEALRIAVAAIKENQKYRLIGSVEEVAAVMRNRNRMNERGKK